MTGISHMRAALLLSTAFGLALPLAAQQSTQTSPEPEPEPSYLESFLEDTLSSDSQYISVTGLSGALSSQASIARLTVADEAGIWLDLKDAQLDWNRLALLRGNFSVNQLVAKEITVLRAPQPLPEDPSLPAPEATPFELPELPVSINIGEIRAERIELGADLLGEPASLNLKGGFTLAEGNLATDLNVNRLDKPGDRLILNADYVGDSRQIALNLALDEAAGGLISTALDLPGSPSLGLSLAGNGPVEDFTAQITLASNGAPRLTGEVVLKAGGAASQAQDASEPEQATTAASSIGFSADLGGDIDVLLHPDFRPFFGPNLRLSLRGETSAETGTTVDSLALRTQALTVSGAVALTPAGKLDTANLRANIAAPQGQAAVVLPISGADTTLASAQISASKTRVGDWSVDATLTELSHPQARVPRAHLQAKGLLAEDQDALRNLDGTLTAALQGLQLRDPALARAVGEDLRLSGQLSTRGTSALTVTEMQLQGSDYQISGDVAFDGLQAGLKITADLHTGVANLVRFSDLAELPLTGAVQAQIEGSLTPLSGSFDADLAMQGQGLTFGIAELDRLTEGNIALTFQGGRDENGLRITSLQLDGNQLTAQAQGDLDSDSGALTLQARLKELNLLLPQMSGPLTLQGDVSRSGDTLTGLAQLTGPHSSFAKLDGSVRLDGNADFTFDAALDELQRFLPELPGKVAAVGQAQRRQGVWQIKGDATAPAGAEARLQGSFDEATGLADMTATGQLRLEGANPFITPNLVSGAARFDLALQGAPGLEALSGSISTSGASLALPAAAQRIDDITANVTLAQARAQLNLTARPRDGGSLQASGPVALQAPFDSALQIGIRDVVVTDHLSYDTILNGDLRLAGQLIGTSLLSGRIDVGETNINLNTAGGSISAAPIPPIRHINETRQSQLTRARAGLIESGGSGGSASNINLDVLIDAPSRVHARGRGLRAELGGRIQLRGSTAALAPAGQISLVRGTFDILGRRLDLDEGRITLLGDLKPYLEFQSSASTATGTATLEISGPVDAPVIEVTSDPPRPSEEALALLLFGDDIQNLSPLALARLASSALELSGRGLGTESKLRDGTGADKVDLGLDNLGSGLLGIGGYVSENVYTDFNVNTRGDSELSINLDVSNSITMSGTVDSEGETGVGLFFKRDY